MLSRFLENPINLGIPFLTTKYEFREGFVVYDKIRQKDVIISSDENLEKWVELELSPHQTLKIKLAVLVCLVYKASKMCITRWRFLDVLYKDGNPENIHPSNLIWKYPESGVRIPHQEFRFIPGFSRYLINSKGEVLNYSQSQFMSPYKDKMGYSMFGVTPDVGKRTIVGMHRLLALAFLPYPCNVDELDVNHKDGNKSNNSLSNLEWSTRKRNCDHAYSTGLRTDNKPVLVRNAFSKVVVKFYSIEEAARCLNVDGETIRLRCQTAGQKVYIPGVQFKFENETKNWKNFDNVLDGLRETGTSWPVMVFNKKTNLTEKCIGFSSAAEKAGLKPATLGYRLARKTSTEYGDFVLYFPNFENLSLSFFSEMKKKSSL